jgi:membrane-associated phospholipid phosphatase
VNNAPDFKRLLRGSLVAFLLGAILVAVCYFFVDRPVAFFVRDQGFDGYEFLKWFTYPPAYFQDWSPVVLVGLMVRRAFGPFHRCELALLAATISVVLADQFKQSLAFVFGRTWPDTWIDNNPSLLRDGVSHFNFFHGGRGGRGYQSFPSGHTARTLAAAAVVWIAYPWWRWAAVAASLAVAVGLIGMNYHFVGDVVAGGFIGGLVGTYTAACCGLWPNRHGEATTS